MKLVGLFLFVVLSFSTLGRERCIKGRIVFYKSNGDLPTGIHIQADSQEDTYTSIDGSGSFELRFTNKNEGQAVLLTINRVGWTVIDDNELSVYIPSSLENRTFLIYMCRSSELTEALINKPEYSRLTLAIGGQYRKNLTKQITYLKEKIESQEHLGEKIDSKISLLEAQLSRIDQKSDELFSFIKSKDYAPNTFSLRSKVDTLFTKNQDITEILNKVSLSHLDELHSQAKSTVNAFNIEAANSNYILRAKLLIGIGALEPAQICFEKAHQNALDNPEIAIEAGNYFMLRRDFSKALSYFYHVVETNSKQNVRAYAYRNISILEYYSMNGKRARAAIDSSLNLYLKLEERLEKQYAPMVADVYEFKEVISSSSTEEGVTYLREAKRRYDKLYVSDQRRYASEKLSLDLVIGSKEQTGILYSFSDEQIKGYQDCISHIEDTTSNLYSYLQVRLLMFRGLASNSEFKMDHDDVHFRIVNIVNNIQQPTPQGYKLDVVLPKLDEFVPLERKFEDPTYFSSIYLVLLELAYFYASEYETLQTELFERIVSFNRDLMENSMTDQIYLIPAINSNRILAKIHEFDSNYEKGKEYIDVCFGVNAVLTREKASSTLLEIYRASLLLASAKLSYCVNNKNDGEKVARKKYKEAINEIIDLYKELQKVERRGAWDIRQSIKNMKKCRRNLPYCF